MDIIESQGVIIATNPHGETSSIIDIFTQNAGLIKGYVKGARSKKNTAIYQKGNLVTLTHTRRLSEQLGNIQADLNECIWQILSAHRLAFKIFNLLCDLKKIILSPHVYEPQIYHSFVEFIDFLRDNQDQAILKRAYVEYLYFLLQKIGYAPDFTRCSVTGQSEDLIYVSPRSANAICQEIGKPYHEKMLVLPEFLKNTEQSCDLQDIENGQKIMQLCYNIFIFYPQEMQLSITV